MMPTPPNALDGESPFVQSIMREIVTHRKARRGEPSALIQAAKRFARIPHATVTSAENQRLLGAIADEYAGTCRAVNVFLTREGLDPADAAMVRAMVTHGEPCWGRRYGRKVLGRLGSCGDRSSNFGLTLTMIKQPDRCVKDDVELAQRAWNIMWTELRRMYPGIKFVRVWEIGRENSNVHMHAVIFRAIATRRLTEWIERRWFELTGATQVDISRSQRGIQHAIKYISKGLNDKSRGWFSNLLLWAARVRRFSSSRGFLPAHQPAGWRWQGFLFGKHWEPGSFWIYDLPAEMDPEKLDVG